MQRFIHSGSHQKLEACSRCIVGGRFVFAFVSTCEFVAVYVCINSPYVR